MSVTTGHQGPEAGKCDRERPSKKKLWAPVISLRLQVASVKDLDYKAPQLLFL